MALGRLVPIIDDGRYSESSEIEGWRDALAEAVLLLLHADTNRRH